MGGSRARVGVNGQHQYHWRSVGVIAGAGQYVSAFIRRADGGGVGINGAPHDLCLKDSRHDPASNASRDSRLGSRP